MAAVRVNHHWKRNRYCPSVAVWFRFKPQGKEACGAVLPSPVSCRLLLTMSTTPNMQIPRVKASVKLAENEMKKVLRNLDRANASLGGHLSNEALDSKRNVLKSLHYLKLAKRTVSRRYQVLNVLKGTELRNRTDSRYGELLDEHGF